MAVNQLAGIFGTLIVLFYVISMLNLVLRVRDRKALAQTSSTQTSQATISPKHPKVLELVMEYHRIFGIAALLSLIAHMFVTTRYIEMSTSGIVAGLLMLLVFSLGAYGYFIKKREEGSWTKIHRIASILLIISILIHTSTV